MEKARKLPENCPFWGRSVTILDAIDGSFSHYMADKEQALRDILQRSGTVYLAAWTGRYTTDIFAITADDATRLLAQRLEKGGIPLAKLR